MNKLKKTLFAVLGIGAAVGLGSLMATRPQATLNDGCCRNIDRPVATSSIPEPKKPKMITLTFICGPSTIKLKEPYAHERKITLSNKRQAKP